VKKKRKVDRMNRVDLRPDLTVESTGVILLSWKNVCPDDQRRLRAIEKFLGRYPRLLSFAFHPEKPELRKAPKDLLDQMGQMSRGEKTLIRVALDIWSDSGDATLSQITSLDPLNLISVFAAIQHASGIPSE
jgi:hypothetical protein